MAIEHHVYHCLAGVNICREFDRFEVKVPIIFFATAGFSVRRDARYMRFVNRKEFNVKRNTDINSTCLAWGDIELPAPGWPSSNFELPQMAQL